MNNEIKLRRLIANGTIKVTIITGPDGGDCPNCPGGNAMICRGECPEGFEPHHFWKLGLDLQACRDCGHSVVAPIQTQEIMDGKTWQLPPAITANGTPRYYVKVNGPNGDLYWIVDRQSQFPAGDGRGAVWSGNDKTIADCECGWFNGDFDHIGSTPPPNMD